LIYENVIKAPLNMFKYAWELYDSGKLLTMKKFPKEVIEKVLGEKGLALKLDHEIRVAVVKTALVKLIEKKMGFIDGNKPFEPED